MVTYATDATADVQAKQLALNIKAAIDNGATAIMMVDRDLVITYVNDNATKLFTKYAKDFQALWPGFEPYNMIGKCVDAFHKNPGHQRRLLSDPKNLPYSADIAVGPLRFSLSVNAGFDLQGNYNGNILEWEDVTDLRKTEATNADFAGQIAAIGRAQAVIEFQMDGTILSANDNFLNTFGYSLGEIKGKHHRMFLDDAYAHSSEYREFWASLNRAEYQAAEFKRLGKNGKEVWIQASYNPILDLNGKPFKVVKYATDITAEVKAKIDLQRKVDQILDVVKSAEQGDLTREVPVSGSDAVGQMGEGLGAFLKALRQSVFQILDERPVGRSLFRPTHRHKPANGRQRGRDCYPGQGGFSGQRRCFKERRYRRRRRRRDAGFHTRNRQEFK